MVRVEKLLLSLAMVVAMAPSAHAKRLFDYNDATKVADAVLADLKQDDVLAASIDGQLASLGLYPAQAKLMRQQIGKRLFSEARAIALSTDSRSFEDEEQAKDLVMQRVRVLRFNALNDPKGYANGRRTSYIVTAPEAERLQRGLLATYIEHEMPLRERLDEMITLEEISREDVTALRLLARENVLMRGKAAINEMRGAAFFSSYDAETFLEYELAAEIDAIRGDKLGDPLTRNAWVNEARERFPQGGVPVASKASAAGFAR